MNTELNSFFRGTRNKPEERLKRSDTFITNMNLDIGDFKWSVSTVDFKGWLLCDGRQIGRAHV